MGKVEVSWFTCHVVRVCAVWRHVGSEMCTYPKTTSGEGDKRYEGRSGIWCRALWWVGVPDVRTKRTGGESVRPGSTVSGLCSVNTLRRRHVGRGSGSIDRVGGMERRGFRNEEDLFEGNRVIKTEDGVLK